MSIITLLFTVCLLLPSLAAAQHLLRVGLGHPYATIQAAINAAGNADTIVVDEGDYPEYLTFPRPVSGLSILGEGDGSVWGMDTLNATNLTVDNLRFITTRLPSAVTVRSPGLRLLNVQCDVVGPCIRTPAPVSGVTLQSLMVNSQSAVQVNGTGWLIDRGYLASQNIAIANFVALNVLGSGHVIRDTGAYVRPASGTRTLVIQGQYITVESSIFGGGGITALVQYSNNVTIQDTSLFSYQPGTLLIVNQPGANLVVRRNSFQTIGFSPYTTCAIRLPIGTPGVMVRGNRFRSLKEAYCGGVSTSTIVGNLLRDILYPDPGPTDVFEPLPGS